MILRVKILLLWLLALAIPVQGFAAVLQSGCAPAMLQANAVHTTPMMPTMSPTMHAGMSMHDHAAHDQAMDMQMAKADPAQQQHQHPQHKSPGSCSSCATCTVGAVLPLALPALPTPDLPARHAQPAPDTGFVGFTPENPDRPPALS